MPSERTLQQLARRRTTRRDARRGERGAAMVEFMLVSLLFLVLVFGILSFGVLLSLKQSLTQTVGDAARATIPIVDDEDTVGVDERYEATDLVLAGLTDFDKSCGTPGRTAGVDATSNGGVTCLRKIHDCAADTSNFAAIASVPDVAEPDTPCITVRIEFDHSPSNRIVPGFPIISAVEPDELTAQATVRLVPVPVAP